MNVVPVAKDFRQESLSVEVTALKVVVPELQTAVAVADVIVGNGFTSYNRSL
jgi:hypothetical protein